MADTKLEDIIPQNPTFYLAKTGKEHRLRLFSLDDRVWVTDKFGSGDAIKEMFAGRDWARLSLLAYRLLEDKRDFKPEEIEEEDDDGNLVKRMITGPQKFRMSVHAIGEELEVFKALSASIAKGNPMVTAVAAAALKKSHPELLEQLKQTGPTSLTSSPANTDGPSRKSESSRSAKSTSRSRRSGNGKSGSSRSRRS